jgi:hypothetical protein
MTTNRFKVGDRVTVIAKDAFAHGLSGEIKELFDGKYLIDLDGVTSGLEDFDDDDLEPEERSS